MAHTHSLSIPLFFGIDSFRLDEEEEEKLSVSSLILGTWLLSIIIGVH